MIEAMTREPLKVLDVGTVGPYIRTPLSRLPEVRSVLDEYKVRYWVEEQAISLNEGPYVVAVNLGRGEDAAAIQIILNTIG